MAGTLGQERTAWLDSLHSTLHGLEEVVSKKRAVDKTARKEANSLGGPATIGALLDSSASKSEQESRQEGVRVRMAGQAADDLGSGDGDDVNGLQGKEGSSVTVLAVVASSSTREKGGGGEETGWVSGPQLKAFEEEIRARCASMLQ